MILGMIFDTFLYDKDMLQFISSMTFVKGKLEYIKKSDSKSEAKPFRKKMSDIKKDLPYYFLINIMAYKRYNLIIIYEDIFACIRKLVLKLLMECK